MDHHVKKFYCQFSEDFPEGKFHRVIALHEAPDLDWPSAHKQFPSLSKGWYELASQTTSDRIEFMRDYWLSKLAYHPRFSDFIVKFFDGLDDIGVFVYQHKFDSPIETDIVYSLKNNSGFFRGASPSSESLLNTVKAQLSPCSLPEDYLAFVQIHNGFCKTTDCTGLIKLENLVGSWRQFQHLFLDSQAVLTTTKGIPIDPATLVPFYESFGMPFYQCFWSEWYPEQEMGNVYFSGTSLTISDVTDKESLLDAMAFPTFLDWLMFYLEKVE